MCRHKIPEIIKHYFDVDGLPSEEDTIIEVLEIRYKMAAEQDSAFN